MDNTDPPPPDYGGLPDTGAGGHSDHELRIRKLENCTNKTLAAVKHTDKQIGLGVKLAAGVLFAVLGSAGAFFSTGIQTTERVERNGDELKQAAEDRREIHDDVDALTVSVTELRSDVRSAGREAEQREKRTTMAIDNLTEAVSMRRRR